MRWRSLVGLPVAMVLVASAQAREPQQPLLAQAPAQPSAAERLAEADALTAQGRELRHSGKSAEAQPLLKRALDIRRDVLGPDDPSVARAIDDLGSAYYNTAAYAEAEALYRQAAATAEKAFGPRNLELASVLGDLGAALREEGKFAEAEQIVQRSLSIRSLLLSKDDPTLAGSLNNLGRNYLKQGKYPAAENVLTESLRIYRKAYGADAPVVQQGQALLDLIKHGEAAPPPADIATNGSASRAPLTLRSGAVVSLASVGPYVSSAGWAGYVLLYDTSRSLKDEALRQEVDEIWQFLFVDATKAGYDKALIVAKSAPSPDAPASASFSFKAAKDGWHAVEPDDRIQKGLDAEFVRDFITRFDWLVEHHDGIAVALYLAEDWKATAKNVEQGQEQNVSLDRDHFVAAVQVLDQIVHNHTHERRIVAISIDPDGKSAEVKSVETETSERNGAKLTTIGQSVDVVRLTDDHVQLIQSFEDAVTSADKPL